MQDLFLAREFFGESGLFTECRSARMSMRVAAAFLLFRKSCVGEDKLRKLTADNEHVSTEYKCEARAAVLCILACWGFAEDVVALVEECDFLLFGGPAQTDLRKRAAEVCEVSSAFYRVCESYEKCPATVEIARDVASVMPFGEAWCAARKGQAEAAEFSRPNTGFIVATVSAIEGNAEPRPTLTQHIWHAFSLKQRKLRERETAIVEAVTDFCSQAFLECTEKQWAGKGASKLPQFFLWSSGAIIANKYAQKTLKPCPANSRREQ